MKLITCENLTLGYEGKAILSGLNFTVNSGDYLCIVGEKRVREIYVNENSSSSAVAYGRNHYHGGWTENQ